MNAETVGDDWGVKIAEWVQEIVADDLMHTERQMALYVKPRPRWLPHRVWRLALRLLLYRTERYL